MPLETLRPTEGCLAGVTFTSVRSFRILNKGPNYFRPPAGTGTRKLSAVERLEADKTKYVKSQQVALTRQAPIKAPVIRKPLIPPVIMPQGLFGSPTARKVPCCLTEIDNRGGKEVLGERRPFNLDILNNLIEDVCNGAQSPSSTSPPSSSPSSGVKSICSSLSAEQEKSIRFLNNFKPMSHSTTNSPSTYSCTSSLLSNNHYTPAAEFPHRRPPVPSLRTQGVPLPYNAPNSVTVRRVDVRPHADLMKPPRAGVQPYTRPRQIPQGWVAYLQHPPPLPPPQSQNQSQPPTKVNTSSQTMPSSPAHPPPSPKLVRADMILPASPPLTCISNASSKCSSCKHPSLHRSKSDLSDRYSRATADLERFFNYCGLDLEEVEGLGGVEHCTRPNSDIVSVSKLRSLSTTSSECGGDSGKVREYTGNEDDMDGPLGMNERVPYGISVIERNARVIKWLYGIRQARGAHSCVSNV